MFAYDYKVNLTLNYQFFSAYKEAYIEDPTPLRNLCW